MGVLSVVPDPGEGRPALAEKAWIEDEEDVHSVGRSIMDRAGRSPREQFSPC